MKTMTAKHIKEMARALGADLCGIAPVERFEDAPEGFRPKDIFSDTQAVVVLAKRFPEGAISSASPVPYTFASETILREVFRVTCEFRSGSRMQAPPPCQSPASHMSTGMLMPRKERGSCPSGMLDIWLGWVFAEKIPCLRMMCSATGSPSVPYSLMQPWREIRSPAIHSVQRSVTCA